MICRRMTVVCQMLLQTLSEIMSMISQVTVQIFWRASLQPSQLLLWLQLPYLSMESWMYLMKPLSVWLFSRWFLPVSVWLDVWSAWVTHLYGRWEMIRQENWILPPGFQQELRLSWVWLLRIWCLEMFRYMKIWSVDGYLRGFQVSSVSSAELRSEVLQNIIPVTNTSRRKNWQRWQSRARLSLSQKVMRSDPVPPYCLSSSSVLPCLSPEKSAELME